MKFIVTHGGAAHEDDFLSCCAMLARYPLCKKILRLNNVPKEYLEDEEIIVLDIGMEYDPYLRNFDHHQFPPFESFESFEEVDLSKEIGRQYKDRCAFSLVLKYFGYEDLAEEFLPWLNAMEINDCRGASGLAKEMNIDSDQVISLKSGTELLMRKIFSEYTELNSGDYLFKVMRDIGKELFNGLAQSDRSKSWWEENTFVKNMDGINYIMVDGLENELDYVPYAWKNIDRIYNEDGIEIDCLILPDTRGEGYKLCRVDGSTKIDFRRLDKSETNFIANSGFIATTKDIDKEECLRLLQKSII